MSLRPSHPLLLIFAGFAVFVAARAPDHNGDDRPALVAAVADHGEGSRRAGPGHFEARSIELCGRLLDAVGLPLANATLVDRRGGQSTRSAQDGSFSLPVAAGRRVRLEARASDGRCAELTVLSDGTPVVVVLRPPRPWVQRPPVQASDLHGGEGLIRGFDGNVVVTVCETGESVCAQLTGIYHIPIPASAFHLIAHDSAGHVAKSEEIAAPRPEQGWVPLPDLTLHDGAGVSGYIRDVEGDPVADAPLMLRGHGEEHRLVSGEDGGFDAAGLLPGEYVVTALPRDGQVGCSQEFDVMPSGNPVIELGMQGERPLDMTIEDDAGNPQPGVFVQVTESDNTWSAGKTDEAGKVMVRGLGGGELSFEVYRSAGDSYAGVEIVRFDRSTSTLILR